MKHLQIYEDYNREEKSTILDAKGEKIMKDYIDSLIDEEKFKKGIKKISLEDFLNEYFELYNTFGTFYDMEYYKKTYEYFRENNLGYSTPQIHNSIFDYIKESFYSWMEEIMYDRMIDLLEKKVKKGETYILDDYKEYAYEDYDITERVLKHFSWYYDSIELGLMESKD